jgi:hypothetical protein
MSNKPLEKLFFSREEGSDTNELPALHTYGSLYKTTLANLVRDIYPTIDIGLAIHSKPKGIFTFHNKDHFDEVVSRAGELLSLSNQYKSKDKKVLRLNAYELFVLLVAIRIHDAGNCLGRDQHEKKCYEILQEVGGENFPFSNEEIRVISDIAQAHGGTAADGKNKDVISLLAKIDHIGNVRVSSQRIAAIVRFSDEVAETRLRSLNFLSKHDAIPHENEIFHAYASSIMTSKIEEHESSLRVVLNYRVESKDVDKKYGKNDGVEYLIDEIRIRLTKMNRERIYCNRFVDAAERISSIFAIVRVAEDNKILWEHKYHIVDEGYPQHEGEPKGLKDLKAEQVLVELTKH